MTNLVIDIGNTATKIGVFSHHILTKHWTVTEPIEQIVTDLLHQTQFDYSIVASVRKDNLNELESILKAHTQYISFSTIQSIPINNQYASPATLGADRLAGVIAAQHLFPNTNVLVIDLGTGITYDLLTKQNEYLGGAISPGIAMKFKALHHYTAKLPLIPETTPIDTNIIGNNTTNAMRAGIIMGTFYEVKGFIEAYQLLYPALKVILSGGDASLLQHHLKKSIFAHQIFLEPHLVLKGLNTAIQYQHAS